MLSSGAVLSVAAAEGSPVALGSGAALPQGCEAGGPGRGSCVSWTSPGWCSTKG